MRIRLRHFTIAFAATAAVFLLLDAAWLSSMTSRLYRPAIGHVMRDDFDVLAAALFYTIYLVGVIVFVVASARDGRTALWRVCYATYDLTNQATVTAWPWHVTLIDLAWGAFVTGVAGWAGFRASRWTRG
jgi:uncharacterized membrane protein